MISPSDQIELEMLLNAYVDNELDTVSSLAFESRLTREPALKAEYDRLIALRRALRIGFAVEKAPASLRDSLINGPGIAGGTPLPGLRRVNRHRASWQAMAAAVVLAAGLGSASTYLLTSQTSSEAAVAAVIAGHVRGLVASHSTDIASSDRHTVKPWFNGRLSFAPKVKDLAKDGFPLLGGRIDVIGGQPAGTLVYRRRQHLVSLTATPDEADIPSTPLRLTRDGFSVVRWREDGITYWAVSDLAMTELEELAKLFRSDVAVR